MFEVSLNETSERPKPKFPDRISFQLRLMKLLRERPSSELPIVPKNPTPVEIARYGQADWQELNKNSPRRNRQGLGSYLYGYAKYMNKPLPDGAQISIIVGNSWQILDGRHSTLVLKLLGPEFVENSGISERVKVKGPPK